MAKRFLILGGAGYLGARIAQLLLELGEVTVTARNLTPAKQVWARSQGTKLTLRAFDSSAVEPVSLRGPFDCVLNLATPGSSESAKDPQRARAGALASAELALQLVKTGAASRLVHFSSFHVYGQPGQTAYDESDTPHPKHPYGQTHLAVEESLRPHMENHSVLVLRPTNMVAAPAHPDLGLQDKLLFLDCCRQAARDGIIRLVNEGGAQRDFLPLADALSAIKQIATAERVPSGTYNLALGKSQSLRTFVERIAKTASGLLDREIRLAYGDGRDPYDKPFSVATAALQSLGWKPKADFEPEIRSSLRFFQNRAIAA